MTAVTFSPNGSAHTIKPVLRLTRGTVPVHLKHLAVKEALDLMPFEEKPLPEVLNFDYLKSSQFRVVHADGAFFALTTQGGLTISFFAERQPIPRRVTHKVNKDGSLGEEILDARVVRDAVIRDTEVAVTMTMDTAKRVRDKLDEILKKAEEVSKKTKELKEARKS
jgi:hypothetical protein